MTLRANAVPLICAGAVVAMVSFATAANRAATPAPKPAAAAAPAAKVAVPTSTPAAIPPVTTLAPEGSGFTLSVAETTLGVVVVDAEGRTLYRFEKDAPEPPTSTCFGGCLEAWPAVVADASSVIAPDIEGSLIGSITRPDGTPQLTLKGWPLYYYAGDANPGDVKGEGIGGLWHAIAPDGTPAAAAAQGGGEPSTAPTTDTGGDTPIPIPSGSYGG